MSIYRSHTAGCSYCVAEAIQLGDSERLRTLLALPVEFNDTIWISFMKMEIDRALKDISFLFEDPDMLKDSDIEIKNDKLLSDCDHRESDMSIMSAPKYLQ